MRIQWLSFALVAVLGATACGGDDDTKADAAAPATPSCTSYCTTIMSACTGANAQYKDMAQCTASCAGFTVGTKVDDTKDNTVGCREYHATAAKMNATVHCPHAGPSGGALCGTPCEGFCSIVQKVCANEATKPDTFGAECATKCAAFEATTPFKVEATGNNLACRTYHATAASVDAKTHCAHVASASTTCM